jgi:hypothetical protein
MVQLNLQANILFLRFDSPRFCSGEATLSTETLNKTSHPDRSQSTYVQLSPIGSKRLARSLQSIEADTFLIEPASAAANAVKAHDYAQYLKLFKVAPKQFQSSSPPDGNETVDHEPNTSPDY